MLLGLQSFLGMKRRARRLLENPEGEKLLAWLSQVCRANQTTWQGDRDAMLVAEGRRQVWLAIRELLDLSDAKVAALMEEDLNE